jgi:hypothetical protein
MVSGTVACSLSGADEAAALGAKCSVGVAQSLAHHNAMNAAQMAQIVIVGLFLGFLLWFLLE